jgi:predicted nuclease of restriction endonuclease-like RecB superfamily
VENLVLAVSENLDCTSEDIDLAADRVLWFKTGIHVCDVVDLAEKYGVQATPADP